MNKGLRRILAAGVCLAMVLGSCGKVDQVGTVSPVEPVSGTEITSQETTVDAEDSSQPEEEETVTTAKKQPGKTVKTTAAGSKSRDTVTTAKVYAPPSNQSGRTNGNSSSGNSGSSGSSSGSHSSGGGSSSGSHSSGSSGSSSGGRTSSGSSGGSSSQRTTSPAEPKSTTTVKTTDAEPKTTTTVTTAAPLPPNATPGEMLAAMSLKQKVYQMFIVTPEDLTGTGTVTSAGESMKAALEECPVGGVILFAANLNSREQTSQLLADMQAFSEIGMFTAVDEEGGTVARCAQKLGTAAFSDMASYGEYNDSDTAYQIGQSIGMDLRELGFNLDFAPVADVNINPANELGRRIFSSDPGVVANMATYVALGLQSQGVSSAMKHFPGLGAESGNTHTDSFVTIDRSVDDLRSSEFIPFAAGINAGVNFVMVGHQITTGFGDNLPADLSHTAVSDYLRGELGFQGIAITDAQQMNTIVNVYGADTAAVMSVQAGIDIILMPASVRTAAGAVIAAVENGTISEDRINESVMRILNKKYERGIL